MKSTKNTYLKYAILLLFFFKLNSSYAKSVYPGIGFQEFSNFVETHPTELQSIEAFSKFIDSDVSWIAPMVIKSRSLQDGDHYDPRVLFVSPPKNLVKEVKPFSDKNHVDNFLIFSINGSQHQRNGSNIELVSFDHSRPPGKQVIMQDILLSDKQAPQFSAENPTKCLKCHGSNPRLIFEPIGRWPGLLNSLTNRGEWEEKDLFKWANNNDHPVFQNLQHSLGPFSENTQLNEAVRIANSHRIVHFILESDDYQSYKFLIASALTGCNNIDQAIPKAILERHQNTDWLLQAVDTNKKLSFNQSIVLFTEDTAVRDNIFFEKFDLINKQSKEYSLTLLRWVFESRGIGIAHWFSGVMEGLYRSSQDFTNLKLLNLYIEKDSSLSFLKGKVPPLSNLFSDIDGAVSKHDKICQDLKSKSLAQFSQFPPKSTIRPRLKKLDINNLPLDHFTSKGSRSCKSCHSGYLADYSGPRFSRRTKKYPVQMMLCANCHTGKKEDRVAPHIPFNDEKEFEFYLQENDYMYFVIGDRLSEAAFADLTHMPPVFFLNKTKREKISNYLNDKEKKN